MNLTELGNEDPIAFMNVNVVNDSPELTGLLRALIALDKELRYQGANYFKLRLLGYDIAKTEF